MRLKGYLRGLGAGMFISAVLMGIATSGKGTLTDAEIKERAAALGMVEEDDVLVKPKIEETIPELPVDDGGNDVVKDPDNASVPNVEIEAQEETIDKTEDKAQEKTDEKQEEKTGDKQDKKEEAVKENVTEDKGQTEADASVEDIRAKEDRAMGGQNNTAAPAATSDKEKQEESKEDKQEDNAVGKPGQDKEADSFTLQIASGSTSFTVAKLLQKGGVIDDAADFDDYLCKNNYDNKINHGVFKIPAGAGYEDIAKIITGRK